jgi:hypothetical protein
VWGKKILGADDIPSSTEKQGIIAIIVLAIVLIVLIILAVTI